MINILIKKIGYRFRFESITILRLNFKIKIAQIFGHESVPLIQNKRLIFFL
jgi:hypothetical protein